MTGAAGPTGGFVAASLEEAGHTVFKVGKGGPDHHMDFRSLSYPDVCRAFDVFRHRVGVFPDVLILNTRLKGEKDFQGLHPEVDLPSAFYVEVVADYMFSRRFISEWEQTFEEEKHARPLVVSLIREKETGSFLQRLLAPTAKRLADLTDEVSSIVDVVSHVHWGAKREKVAEYVASLLGDEYRSEKAA